MAIISSIPNAFVAGTTIASADVNADFQSILTQVNANAAPLDSPVFTGGVKASSTLGVGMSPTASTLAVKAPEASAFGIDLLGRDSDDLSIIRFVDHTGGTFFGLILASSAQDLRFFTGASSALAATINSSQVMDFVHQPTVNGAPINGTIYTSTGNAVYVSGPNGVQGTHAHGLTPTSSSRIQGLLVCSSADQGYSSGDTIAISSGGGQNGSITFGFNSTNVFYWTDNRAMQINSKTNGSNVSINGSKWTLTLVMIQ